MNQDVNENRKLFWKEVSKANEGKMESCSRIKDGNGRLALEEIEVLTICKKYFENLYSMNTQERVEVHMYGFDGILRAN